MFKVKFTVSLLLLSLSLWLSATAYAQGTAFTYQGKLTDSGNLANGNYDLQFKLFDTVTVGTGTQQGSNVTVSNVTVSNGIFTVSLDFGVCATCFNGSARFLEIAVKPTSGGSFTTLTPRQPITSTPYAINAAQLGGLAASGFLQNSTSQQASSNFNISGDGTAGGTMAANIVNATTQFNLGGSRVLSAAGSGNLFAGIGAGTNNTGINNAFFGINAGQSNTTGQVNAFFGAQAGFSTTTGFSNSFFGAGAGQSNTTGIRNTFIGRDADFNGSNSTGDQNTLLGAFSKVTAGSSNATAIGYNAQVTQSNSLVLGSINGVNGCDPGFGCDTVKVGIGTPSPQFRLDVVGDINTTTQYDLGGSRVLSAGAAGSGNLFAGLSAGTNPNNTGFNNAFFGAAAGNANTTGNANSFFGFQAGQHNSTACCNNFFGFQAGFANTTGHDNVFFGNHTGLSNTTGFNNSFFGNLAGVSNTTGQNNTFIGFSADFNSSNPTGDNNTMLGATTNVNSGVSNGTAIGANASVTQSNSLILGSINGVNFATADTNVGIGTTAPVALLDVQRDGVAFPETARFTSYGTDNKVLGRSSGGSRAAPTATPIGRDLLQLGGSGHDGTTGFVSNPKATIILEAAETWTSTAQGTNIRFNTTSIGTTMTNTKMIILDDGSVGIGTASPADLLHVNGILRVQTLGAAGSTSLCRNASNQIATCSSSLRYKTAIQPFLGGLEIVNRLRPITFTWKQSGIRDLGFGAEEVAKVEPLFTFTNEKGEVEGVKYDRLSVVLVNAVKELKQQNDQLKQENVAIKQENQTIRQQQQFLQAQFQALKQVVCKSSPTADICKP